MNDTKESPPDHQTTPSKENSPMQLASKVCDQVANLAGIEKIEGFSLTNLFAEVFKKHSTEDIEAYFTVGTASTTPLIQDVDTSWPRPWLFFRTFAGAVLVYLLFLYAWDMFGCLNVIPGMIIVGSFVVPISTLIFFLEVNVRRNVSLYQVIRMIFVGGALSLAISLFLFQITGVMELNWLGASIAGIVEEPGKLLALLIVIDIPKYRYTLNGLLLGAAVGTGFAAFESAGYALNIGLANQDFNVSLDTIMTRGILSPLTHIVWTAMCGAALWKIKGERKFNFDMVKNEKFLRIFAIAVAMHMLWNAPIELPFYAKFLALGAVAWIIILALVQDGLKQIREEKAAATKPEVGDAPASESNTTSG